MDSVVQSVEKPRTQRRRRRPGSNARLVAISTYPLYPRQTGGQQRGYELAAAVGPQLDLDVVTVSLTTSPEFVGSRQLTRYLSEHTLLIDEAAAQRETDLRLVSSPISVTDIASGLMWAGIEGLSAILAEQFDHAVGVVLVQPYLVDAAHTLGAGLPIICDEHNDEWLLKRSMYPRNEGSNWLAAKVDEIERNGIESAALVTATTQVDLETLRRRYQFSNSAVVPNGVDTSTIEFVTGADRRRRRMAVAQELELDPQKFIALFVGSGHAPNIDAGRSIIDAAMQIPDAEFLLVGAHSEALQRGRLPANVHLLGRVEDELLDLILAGSDLALNPMHAGSGSNLKLLSYLASGIPVVSTPVGARGIDALDAGVHLVELDDLAAGIDEALGAPAAARAFAGRRYVEQHCDWNAIGRRFAALATDFLLP
jgi:glycosyltransferase involved in cell wall biosynthesis